MDHVKAAVVDGTLTAAAVSYHWWGAHLDLAEHTITFAIGLAIGLPRAYVAWCQARQWWQRRLAKVRP